MAPIVGTPRRASAGRSRKAASAQPKSAGSKRAGSPTPTAPTTEKRKRRYVPGGPGGGGRYIDEEGNEEPVGGTGPGGYNYVGPRGRIGQENARKGITPVVYQRRDRSTRTRTVMPRSQQPAMRFSSAAQAAAAVVQNDGYKPREERSWEEFHPNLDIDAKLMVFSADEVDGVVKTQPTTPAGPLSTNGSTADLSVADTPSRNGAHTPVVDGNGDLAKLGSLPGTPPAKRRPGRPPRDPVAFYAARAVKAGLILTPGAPKTPRIAPLQNQNAKERLTLLQPSYRKVDALAKFEDKTSKYWQAHYVEKSMVNVGYQQTDKFIRPEGTLIQASDLHQEEDLDMSAKSGNDSHIVPVGGSVGRVEYDMDEQDDKWLEAYNAERKSQVIEPITREMFEITITKIEKEWHALEKRMPKPNPKPPQTHRPRSSSAAAVNGEPQDGEEQDSKCAICDDGDCENTNAIVFCDGCDLAVHQECYGVPFIPEGQWLCRKCQLLGRGIPVSTSSALLFSLSLIWFQTCIFCPNIDGGFKQTNSSRWAHLLCAMWIPEVSLGNHTFMEPVMDVEKVPKNRWKLSCYICQQKMGACIQCGNKQCFQAFHVTCARRARLFLKMKNSHGALAELDNSTVLKAFCDKHCPLDYARDNDVSRATKEAKAWYRKTMKGRLWADSQATAVAMRADQQHAHSQNLRTDSQIGAIGHWTSAGDIKKKEAAQPTKPVWKLPSGAPVIPALVYDLVEGSLQRFNIRKRRDWVATACRYWTLKREARRGAALLKRLQLQMETFTSNELARRDFVNMKQGRAKLQRRIDFAKILIADLERLRDLSHAVVERETQKLEFALNHQATVDTIYFPIAKLLPTIVEKALT
jgi:NuA3 HAT complex component NTO1